MNMFAHVCGYFYGIFLLLWKNFAQSLENSNDLASVKNRTRNQGR